MLNLDTQRFFEHHRIWNVESIGCPAISGLEAFPQRRAVERTRLLAKAPTVAKIIFRACAAKTGLGLTVDKEKIVAFAIPARRNHVHALDGADVMPAADDIRQQIILSHNARMFLPVHGVKIGAVFWQRRMFLPVDVVIESIASFV